jgi:hypothetical protein
MIKKMFYLFLCTGFLTGCATIPPKDYTNFKASDPHSLLIVPVVNRSLNVDAPNYFLSSIPMPVAEQGYYVFPVNMVKRILEDEGLSDADMVHSSSTQKLSQLFGADAVLYITINRWDARYLLLQTTITVELKYEIKDGKTGNLLWQDDRIVQYTPQSSSTGNPIGDLISMAVTAAITKAAPDYMPLAHQANALAFKYPGPGIPPGVYARDQYALVKAAAGETVASGNKKKPE